MICPHCGASIPMRPIKSALTGREWEVLAHFARGKTKMEVANHLFLSLATINSHTKNIRRKLGGVSLGEAVRWAERGGRHD